MRYLSQQIEFNEFLRNNALWLSLALVGVILLIVLISVFVSLRFRKKKVGTSHRKIEASAYIDALGGQDNIVSHSLTRSRIVLELKDYEAVDKEKLKEAGVDGFIMMSNKLTLVIKGDADKVNKAIFPGE